MKFPETESELETMILNYLVRNNIFAWRNNNAGIYDPKTGAYRNGNAYSILGVSDILGILPDGRFLAIEVKHPIKRTKPSSAQKAFVERIEEFGGVAFVAHDLGYVVMRLTPFINNSEQLQN